MTAAAPALLAGKLAKLGELAELPELPGALGTGVGVILGTADLRVVTGGPRGVVTVCFCNRVVVKYYISSIAGVMRQTKMQLFVCLFVCYT